MGQCTELVQEKSFIFFALTKSPKMGKCTDLVHMPKISGVEEMLPCSLGDTGRSSVDLVGGGADLDEGWSFLSVTVFRLNTQGDSDQKKEITQGDPLLGNSMIMMGIQHDLLLLENQLPFFILKELFIKTIKTIPDHPRSSCPSLTQFVLSFFGNVMNINDDYFQSTTINLEEDKCFHILHLIHSCFLPISSNHVNPEEDKCFHILHLIHSCFRRIFPNNAPKPSHFSHRASDLDCAGVKFEPDTGVIYFRQHRALIEKPHCFRAVLSFH
ncbi:unnamed protein product [Camellia sinensis]